MISQSADAVHLAGGLDAVPAGNVGEGVREVDDRVAPARLRALPAEQLPLALGGRVAHPCCVLAEPVHIVPACTSCCKITHPACSVSKNEAPGCAEGVVRPGCVVLTGRSGRVKPAMGNGKVCLAGMQTGPDRQATPGLGTCLQSLRCSSYLQLLQCC